MISVRHYSVPAAVSRGSREEVLVARRGPRDELLRDSRGRLLDDTYVTGAVDDAIRHVRSRGRPSLSKSGESPLLRVRISRELDAAIRDAAGRSGVSVSDWVRRALDRAAHDKRGLS